MAKDKHAKDKPEKNQSSKKLTGKGIEDLYRKYGVPDKALKPSKPIKGADDIFITSREYKIFTKQEKSKWISFYEKACKVSGKLLQLKLAPEEEAKVVKAIDIAELDVTPGGVASFSFFVLIGFALLAVSSLLVSFLLTLLLTLFAFLAYSNLKNFPGRLVEMAQIKAGGETIW